MAELVEYNVGSGVAFVSAGRTLLLDGVLGNEATEQLWSVVSCAEATHEVIESLAAFGLRKLGDFALLFVDMERSHVIVRGEARATVTLTSGSEEFTATGALTWSERAYDNVVSVELSLGLPAAPSSLPFGSGVVHASRVRVRFRDEADVGSEAEPYSAKASRDEVGVTGEGGGETEGDGGTEGGAAPLADDAGLTLVGVSEAAQSEQPAPVEISDGSILALGDIDQSPSPEEQSAQEATMLPPEEVQLPEGSGGLADDDFEDLFGNTLFRAIEEAAIREAEEHEGHVDPAPADPPTTPNVVPRPEEPAFFPVAPAPFPQSPPTVLPPVRSEGLIDGVPGVAEPPSGPPEGLDSAAPSASAPPAPPAPEEDGSISESADDEENFTISRAKLSELKSSATGASDESPRVHGVYCEQNHANPPQATHCRLCGSALGQLEPITIPRPVLGVLRFSNGVEAELDGPIVVGRSPRAERVSSKEIPQLVTLPSPDQNISRNHLEIKLDGWHVLVVDLDSVNGTVVTNPGEAPVLLRSGEDVPIVVGSVVTIADEISFVYEVSE